MLSINLSTRRKEEVRKALKENNYNCDNAYQKLMSDAGLFGYAYFGWRCESPYKRMLIKHYWRACLFIKLEDKEYKREWVKDQIKHYLQIK